MWDCWMIQSQLINYVSLFLAKNPAKLFFACGHEACVGLERLETSRARCRTSKNTLLREFVWFRVAHIPSINLYALQTTLRFLWSAFLHIHWGIRHLTLSIKKILDELKDVMIELNLNKDSVLICLRCRMANAQLKAKRQTKAFCATPESNAKLIFT